MALLLAVLFAVAPEANLSLLRPASGTDGLLGVEGARPPDDADNPLQIQLGLDAAWLPVRLGPGRRIDRRIGGWLQLAARLNDDFSLFAQLPVTLRQGGDLSALTASPALGFGVGDIRLGLRHGLLRGPVDLAAQLSVEMPTAQLQSLTGDDRLAVEGLVSGAKRRGQWELLGNFYLRLRAPRDLAAARLGNELGARGGAAWLTERREPWIPRRAYGELELQSSLRALAQATFPIEWRVGATFCASDALAVDLAGGTRLSDGLGAPSLRGVVAVRFAPAFCRPPKQEGPEPGLKELVAVLAEERAAREKAEAEAALVGRALSLLDASEAAARDAALRAEALDLLAASEADARGRLAAMVEEDARDTDGDGVPDYLDNCPLEKGPKENHGCPRAKKQLVILRQDRLEILDKVYFATARARIERRSYRLLHQVAQVLRQHPDLVLVQVQGHTDDQGSAVTNTALSQARAEAVVGYLIRSGVPAGRLVARGFGPSRPVAANTSRAGREKNRRVEFRVLKRRTAREVIEVEEAAP